MHREKYQDYNQLFTDILSTQIIAAIKKIRTQKGRPDSDKIFKEVVKELSTNITLEDIQQVLQHMISDDKLINTQYKGLNSYYVVDTQSVEDTCCEDIDFQKNPTPVVTDSLLFSKHFCGNPKN